MESKVRTVSLGESARVEVPAIERELSRLWVEAAGTAPSAAPSAVLRACALNLLIVTSEQLRPEEASGVVSQITPEHPSRALILSARAEGEPAVEARVSAHCNLMGGGAREICCEQIVLEALGPDALRNLANAALQQLSPELPVFLWWTDDPPLGTEDFDRMARVADRIVIDSSQFGNPAELLEREAELLRDPEIAGALGDLSWGRLTPWREMAAQFFDRQDYRHILGHIDRVEIEYQSGSPSNPIQALLFAGWLASRLGWKYEEAIIEQQWPNRAVRFYGMGHTVSAELRGVPPVRQAPGELYSVTLSATQEPTARFFIGCGKDMECITTRAEVMGEPPVERVVGMEPRSLGELMGEELEVLGHDHIFEEALAVAAHMAR